MLYQYLKIIHIASVFLWAGNVLVILYWKFYADRTKDPMIVGFSQRLITKTDQSFNFLFSIGVGVTGYWMAMVANYDLFNATWLVWGQVTFWFALALWIFLLIPIQIKMTKKSELFEHGGKIGDDYRKLSVYWYTAVFVLAVTLYTNMYFMVFRPY